MKVLGLPSGTLWSTKNIGAKTEKDMGWKFSYGNYYPVDDEQDPNYYDSIGNAMVNGKTINADETPIFDAAYVNSGGLLRMPTLVQVQELLQYTHCKLCIDDLNINIDLQYDINTKTHLGLIPSEYTNSEDGYIVMTSTINNNSIILPLEFLSNGLCIFHTCTSPDNNYPFIWTISKYSSEITMLANYSGGVLDL